MAKQSKGKKKVLRLGVIGSGGIAGVQLDRLKDDEDVELVAASDVDGGRSKSFAERFGMPMHFTDWNEMIAKADLDAVTICTPNYLHYQPTLDALNAGLHVMVEKPLAMNAKEGEEMVSLARKKKKVCTIAFQWRFDARTQMIKAAKDAGTLGDILYARVHALRRRGIPNWGVFGRKELQGGGPLIDIGVHAMEMTHYAMGLPRPVAASAATYTYMGNKKSKTVSNWPNWDYKNYTVEDLATGYVRFDNGATMSIESSFIAHTDDGPTMDFWVMGTKGGAHHSEAKLYYDKDNYMMDASPAYLPKVDFFRVKMRNFVDAILYGKEDQSPIEHGLMIQKILDALYESAEKGKEVAIK